PWPTTLRSPPVWCGTATPTTRARRLRPPGWPDGPPGTPRRSLIGPSPGLLLHRLSCLLCQSSLAWLLATHTFRRGEASKHPRNSGPTTRRPRVPEQGFHACAERSVRFGRENVGSASDPSLPERRRGRRVGVLGPGLTCDSADAASSCLAKRSVDRVPGFARHPPVSPGLICPTWTRGRGSQVRRSAGA